MCHSFKFFFMFFFMSFFAHSQIAIRGTVKDSSNVVIEFANVVLTNQANEIITGTITDEKGFFNLSIKEGAYTLTISFLGYSDWVRNVSINQSIDFGQIVLEENASELDAIVLTAKKKIFDKKVDRLIFNVENVTSLIGADALSALKITPRVRLQNNQVSMIGKDNMQVMINGRILKLSGENLINFLSSISSDDIKKIEVITTPPSKYSAEGNSGLINIVYKTGKNNSWNGTIRTSYYQYTYPRGALGGSFNYNRDKVAISSNINYTNGSRLITDSSTIFYSNQTWEINTPRRVFYKPIFSGSFSFDYKLNKSISLGVQYLGNSNNIETTQNDLTKISNNSTTSIDSLITTNANSKNKASTHSVNVYTSIKLDTIGKKISLGFDYFSFKNDRFRLYESRNQLSNGEVIFGSFNSGINSGIQRSENFSGSLDFVLPLKNIKLDFGGKYSTTNINNRLEVLNLIDDGSFVLNNEESNDFGYEENTSAAYFSATKSFGSKWDAKLGFRLESTNTSGFSLQLNQRNENDYIRLFPTAYLTYESNDDNSFSISANGRIRRPSFEFLNPFRITINQFSFVEGNPFLTPSFSNNFEFLYTRKGNWENTLYYSITKDGFSQVSPSDEITNIQRTVPLNYYDSFTLGLTESYSVSPFSWMELYASLNLYYSKTTSNLDFIEVNDWEASAYISINQSLTLNKKKTMSLGTDFFLQFPTSGNLYSTKQYNSLDISYKYLLLEKQLVIGLALTDVFSSNRPQYAEVVNGIKTEYINYYDNRTMRLSMSYKFGNKKIRVKRRRFGNVDERKRNVN